MHNSKQYPSFPLVSIGMPVYNSDSTIKAAIESILNQSLKDFELIISDNASTDRTSEICKQYASLDSRIRYFRQSENIGAAANFKYVLDTATAKYFMWAAGDDTRTPNFIERCLTELTADSDAICCSATNYFESILTYPKKYQFEIIGDYYSRIKQFLDICSRSHACIYSVFEKEALLDFGDFNKEYIAQDWAIILHLLSKGNFKRVTDAELILGASGVSSKPTYLATRKKWGVNIVFPLYEFTRYFIKNILTSSKLSLLEKTRLLIKIVILNEGFMYSNIKAHLRLLIKRRS